MIIKNLVISTLTVISSVAMVASLPAQAINFTGNGNSGFGGVLGTGSLDISDNGTNIQATFNKGGASFNDALVIYIDSKTGGFNTTSGFNDQQDSLRKGISGVSTSGRSTVNFASGFNADYAIAFAPSLSFGGLWGLANGGNNSLNFLKSVNLTPATNQTASNYNFSFDLSDIALTPNSGASFKFVATYLNPNNSFRSDEAIGNGIASGNPGYSSVSFTNSLSYTTATPVPFDFSPTSGLLSLGALWLAKKTLKKVKNKSQVK
jgi:hypothetical protein